MRMPKKAGRLLYVTGREAAGAVRKNARGGNVEVMPVDVAALLSKTTIEKELSERNLCGFDLVVLPGGVSGDYTSIGRKLGVAVVKGPKQAADISVFLSHLGEVEYSASKPADVVLEKEIAYEVGGIISAARKKKTSFRIGRRNPVYLGEFPHVVAEINDAPKLSDREISAKAKYFVESGASIIDLGFVAGENNVGDVERLVSAVREAVDVPVSVDTLNEEEILAGVDAGADLVLSLSADNIGLASSIDMPFVLVPKKRGRLPDKAGERVKVLLELIEHSGGKNAIADPVLNPLGLGFTESIKACVLFREANPGIPMFFGAGNVTEMLDADSPGVNAVLAGMAAELGASLVFTVEGSNKTRGAVKELSTAVEMAYLARKRGQPMKDLGISLLTLKDKRGIDVIEDEKAGGLFEKVSSTRPDKLDASSFRIYLKDGVIRVVFYERNRPSRAWEGEGAEEMSRGIVEETGISQAHAAYLGRELAKAEIALKLSKNYVQDEDLFQ
jgi:dihydropteroate synthase-like protein